MTFRLLTGLLLVILATPVSVRSQPTERPSHKPVPSSLNKSLRPEEILTQRLRGSREQKSLRDRRDDGKTQGQIRALAEKLLGDEKFVESLRGKFSAKDIQKLLGGVNGLGSDPELLKLLRESLAGQTLSKQQEQLVRRWADRLREMGVREPSEVPPVAGQAQSGKPTPTPQLGRGPSPSPSLPAGRPPSQGWRLDPRTQDWVKRNLDRLAGDVDRWLESPRSQAWRDYARDFARRYERAGLSSPALTARARGLSRYVPRLSNYFPRPRLSALPRLPRLSAPRVGLPSAPRISGASAAEAGKVVLWTIVLAIVALVAWRVGGWYERKRLASAAGWRLGPWPVRPQEVSTGGELVRAFEYLALLCLGPVARTHHHHNLAREIGGQRSLDPERRAEAAAVLAELYEQARYRPESESLGNDDLRRARRELCYLAEDSAV